MSNPVQQDIIIGEVVRRAQAMGMVFGGMRTVHPRRGYEDMWGVILDPCAVRLPPGRQLPCEETPSRYTGLTLTVRMDWWGDCPRFEALVHNRRCSLRKSEECQCKRQ